MARKRSPATPPVPTPRDAEAALQRGDFVKAVEIAKALTNLTPTDESHAHYVKVLAAAFEGYTRLGKVKSVVETLKAAEELANRQPVVAEAVAVLHAKAGEFGKALALAATPRVHRHVADLCVRRNQADGAPAEVLAGWSVVQTAFRQYEAGQDDAAKETLQGIGLTSPFLEWKLFLRGLSAFATNDTARAVENWQRLSAEYLPAKLAAAPRGTIDPAFLASQIPETAVNLRRQAETLASGDLLGGLRAIQKFVGRDQRLQPVWKEVEKVAPKLRTAHPKLFVKLGTVLYEAIIRQGEPTDLKKYRTIFPPPADDPHFHRLEAMACEGSQVLDMAVEHWQKYEAWLAGNPAGWPADLATRARALILHRIGDILEDAGLPAQMPKEFQQVFRSLFDTPPPAKPKGNPDDFYRRSAALAPDWPTPAYDLFDRQVESKAPAAAERTAREFLARRPQDLPMLERLGKFFRGQHRMAESLDVFKQALATNPLDAKLRDNVGLASIATIRRNLIDGDLAACERLVAEAEEIAAKVFPAAFGSLKVTVARKAGRNDDAAEIESRLYADRLRAACVAFDLSVDGLLAKLKPAQRKAADARLKEALANPAPHPSEVYYLYGSWGMYKGEGLTYRGQPTHEKKIVALAENALKSTEGTDVDFESMVVALFQHRQHKAMLKILPKLTPRFPAAPFFPLFEAKTLYHEGRGYGIEYQMARLLDEAKRRAEASSVPRHRMLLEGIDQVRRSLNLPGGVFSSPLFGGDDDEDF
ncbi:UDP-N-acetylglucosamine--peptide N-acetylglucosaminyltransferase SPINDLY family protein [Limnoglobus roseus]|uniref:Tetratricopeptide repeat protein n=1 Tax=Limnoglobus roseus TaxID=2598579 RepID=A0A5C1AL75_9BACT|nr:hypothetical protein [Limnoglobus roseus]QEL19700.1 hypothetical protein PX52LOC_06779 [Limnoglobus roseus]